MSCKELIQDSEYRTLHVFPNREAALIAGFKHARHPSFENVRAYWAGLGIQPLCAAIHTVVIHPYAWNEQIEGEGRLYDILKRRQMVFGDDAVWIDARETVCE